MELNKTSTTRYWQHLQAKEQFQSKYQFLIIGRKKVGIENLKNPKVFVDYYSQTIDDVYEILEEYNRTKKRRVV